MIKEMEFLRLFNLRRMFLGEGIFNHLVRIFKVIKNHNFETRQKN
jgi:hypothetical protein